MHATSILLLALALLATAAMARPGGKRPWPGHHNHGNGENEGTPGRRWSTYRLPKVIRLPHFLTGTLGQPLPTFTVKKILDGKYLLISPALLFKLKDVNSGTETSTTTIPESTTAVPESSTTDQPDSVETTTAAVDEETTTEVIDEESTTDAEMEETTTVVPTFFKKRSFSLGDNEQLLFPDD